MAINIKFDLAGNPEPPTIILAKRNGNKLGQLEVEPESIELNDKLNDVSELSFTLYKYIDNRITNLWDEVVDFKLIYCKEWDMWFEITVELDEETETIKTVMCTQLGQAELSQIMLYDIHINEEGDSNWNKDNKEYKSTILYCPEDTSRSLLHRLLKDKAPHYSIIHVDDTIKNIQRTFSFDGTSIYDAFMEIAEEIGCLFIFHSNSDESGNIQRMISVYDLQQNCLNPDCVHRGEFTDICPKCGSTNIRYGYGEDTTIFVTADELAASGIQLTTDTDAVKNCFKLEAGDDLMTATVVNCNPNGTPYIWYFSDAVKADMSKELVEKIESYDIEYAKYYNDKEYDISEWIDDYNSLVTKYAPIYNKLSSRCLVCNHKGDFETTCPNCGSTNIYVSNRLTSISQPKGYSSLMNIYYNVIDMKYILESSLMPRIDISMEETDAEKQAALLTKTSLSPVAVSDLKIVSVTTADSAILSAAKLLVKPTYKVSIVDDSSSLSDDKNIWEGRFEVTNYSDESDTCITDVISVVINDDEETYVKQKIDKILNTDNEDYSIAGLFEKELMVKVVGDKNVFSGSFYEELKNYALNPLKSFHDACQACIDILIEQGAGDKTINPDLYEKLYQPYHNKLLAIESEILIRENELNSVKGVYNKDKGVYDKDGFQQKIEKLKNEVKAALDFEVYLGKDLWLEFCTYRREDKYSNDNYISDGLDNVELFKRASEFIKVSQDEIYKSAELQHSISTSLKNLLAIEKFKILVKCFSVGNWIRILIDDQIYKLRLLEYNINFGSFDEIPVEFSDVTKIKNGVTDVQEILSQASSMATSYSSVQKQASQGEEVKGTVDQWLFSGLNSAQVRIQSNSTEDIVLDKNGLLCRSYDNLTDTYSPEQLKITHNIMAYTDDNWLTVRQAIGKHDYTIYDTDTDNWIQSTGYGMSADFVTAGQVSGSKIVGGEIYSEKYSSKTPTGTYINLNTGDFEIGGKKLVYDATEDRLLLNGVTIEWSNANKPDIEINDVTNLKPYLDELDELEKEVDASKSTADNAKNIGELLTTKLGFKETEIAGEYVISPVIAGGTLLIGDTTGTYAQITTDGTLKAVNADITGIITADEGEIGGWKVDSNSLYTFYTEEDDVDNTISISISSSGYNGGILCSDKNGKVEHKAYYSKYSNSEGANAKGNVLVSCSGIGIRTYSYFDDEDYETHLNQNIKFYCDDNERLSIDYKGLSYSNNSSLFFEDNGITSTGYFWVGTRYYLSNNYSIRGLKNSGDYTVSTDNSECIGYISTSNRVILGSDNNSTATEVRSPSLIYLKGNGSTSDENRYSVALSYGTVDNIKFGYFMPTYNTSGGTSYTNLGGSSHKWRNVFATNGTIETSDRNQKKDICKLNDKYLQMFDLLEPVSYKMIDGDRIHTGFIAQDVEEAMYKVGLTSKDFGGFCKDVKTTIDENGSQIVVLSDNGTQKEVYSLRYNEFIALNTAKIKQLEQKLEQAIEVISEQQVIIDELKNKVI